MKFVLKNGHIFVIEHDLLVYNKVEGSVVFDAVDKPDEKQWFYALNKGSFKPIVDAKIVLTEEDLTGTVLKLKIKGVGKEDVDLYEIDDLPLTHAILLGKPMQEVYPAIIHTLADTMGRLEKHIDEQLEKLYELHGVTVKETKGDLNKVLDIVDYLNKKGSLL